MPKAAAASRFSGQEQQLVRRRLPLLVVRPHPHDFDGLDVIQNLVDEAVLDIDPPGTSPRKFPYQLLERRRALVRILPQDGQQSFGLWLQAGPGELLRVSLRPTGEYDSPAHQSSSSSHSSTGVFRPSMIDSRISGMAVR